MFPAAGSTLAASSSPKAVPKHDVLPPVQAALGSATFERLVPQMKAFYGFSSTSASFQGTVEVSGPDSFIARAVRWIMDLPVPRPGPQPFKIDIKREVSQ